MQWTCPDCEHSSEDVIALPVIYSLRGKDIRLACWYANRQVEPYVDSATLAADGQKLSADVNASETSTGSMPVQTPPSLDDYFAHFIPCRPIGNRHHGSDPIHDLPPPPCLQDGCASLCEITAIQTAWPRMLHILPETIADTPTAFLARMPGPVIFKRTLRIPTTSLLEYHLVGRILYRPGHFTGEYLIDGRTFSYDSAANGGRLIDIGDGELCTTPRHDVVMYIYTLSGGEPSVSPPYLIMPVLGRSNTKYSQLSQHMLPKIKQDFALIGKWDFTTSLNNPLDEVIVLDEPTTIGPPPPGPDLSASSLLHVQGSSKVLQIIHSSHTDLLVRAILQIPVFELT